MLLAVIMEFFRGPEQIYFVLLFLMGKNILRYEHLELRGWSWNGFCSYLEVLLYSFVECNDWSFVLTPYRGQAKVPAGTPSHPKETKLILPDSGERLLSQPVTTILVPHSWGRHTKSHCDDVKNKTRAYRRRCRGGGGLGGTSVRIYMRGSTFHATLEAQVEWEDLL